MFLLTLKSHLRIHFRKPSEILNPLVFFAVVISLFPLGLGPSPDDLRAVAPAIVWIAALLATLMSLDLMFRGDFEDGSLDQIAISEQSMVSYVVSKVVIHWMISGLPLVALIPVVGLVLFLPAHVIGVMTTGLLLASLALSLIGSIGAALTVGLPKGGLLVTLLILPLYIPILILATAMAGAALLDEPVVGYFYWLAAILLLAAALAPLASAMALRISIDQ